MTNIAKHLQRNTTKRPHVVQIRLSDVEKKQLDDMSEKYGVRPTRLMYELFRFSISQYEEATDSQNND